MKKKFVILPIVLLALVFLFSFPCDKNLTCTGKAMDVLQYPGLWFLVLIPLSLAALILNDQKHKFWLKFTGVFFVLSMFLVFLMPEIAGGVMLNPDRESTNWFLLCVYSLLSIIYCLTQFIKNRKNEKT